MAGDRGLAFVVIGLIGMIVLWVGDARARLNRTHTAAQVSIGVVNSSAIGPVPSKILKVQSKRELHRAEPALVLKSNLTTKAETLDAYSYLTPLEADMNILPLSDERLFLIERAAAGIAQR